MQQEKKSLAALEEQPHLVGVLGQLRARILEMTQGGRRQLAPERELAEQFGVGRATLRKALAILESDGTVVRHVGRGTFINSGTGTAPPQLQALALGGALAIDTSVGLSPRELLEVRYVLEPAIAELAALAARQPDLESIQECMRKREEASQLNDYEHWDFALHMSIARATHNSLLIELLDLVNRMRRSGSWRKFRGPSVVPNRRQESNAQHRAIVGAICRAEPEEAFAAMRTHLGVVTGRYRAYSHREDAKNAVEP